MLARTGPCTSTRTTRIRRRCAAKSRRCSAPRIDQRRRAHVRRRRPLRKIERRERRRGRRSGHPVEGRRQARCACSGCAPEDFQWSTQSPAAFSDVEIGLDANGKMVAYQVDHYMPAMQDDRPVGAVLAGLPTMPAPNEKGRVHRLDRQRHFRSLDLRRRRDSGRTRPRHLPGRPESFAARRRPARSQHANAGTIPAEFPARAGHQRGSGAGRRRRHPVPHRPRQGRARDRRAQGGSRSLGLGDALVAASAMRSRPAPRRCAAGASR